MMTNLKDALREHTPKRRASLWVTLAFAVAITALVLAFRSQLVKLAGIGYLGAFILAVAGNAALTVPFPWIFPVAAMGAVYNPVWIALVAAVGAAIGETAPYLLGRRLATHAAENGLVRHLNALSPTKKWLVVTGSAFSPIASYPGLVGGMMGYPVWATCAITLIAEAAKVLLIAKLLSAGSHFLPAL